MASTFTVPAPRPRQKPLFRQSRWAKTKMNSFLIRHDIDAARVVAVLSIALGISRLCIVIRAVLAFARLPNGFEIGLRYAWDMAALLLIAICGVALGVALWNHRPRARVITIYVLWTYLVVMAILVPFGQILMISLGAFARVVIVLAWAFAPQRLAYVPDFFSRVAETLICSPFAILMLVALKASVTQQKFRDGRSSEAQPDARANLRQRHASC